MCFQVIEQFLRSAVVDARRCHFDALWRVPDHAEHFQHERCAHQQGIAVWPFVLVVEYANQLPGIVFSVAAAQLLGLAAI